MANTPRIKQIAGETVGSIIFVGTGLVGAENNSNLFWDNNNIRLGIGTATPTADLSVNGTIDSITGADFLLAADDNIFIDGTTNNRNITSGVIRIEHTPAIPNTRSINIVIDANNQGNFNASVVDITATGFTSNDIGVGHIVNVDESNSTGGRITAFRVSSISSNGLNIAGLFTTIGVDPVLQQTGVIGDMDFAKKFDDSGATFTNVLNEFIVNTSPSSNVSMFDDDNDIVYIGNAVKFGEIQFILDTIASGPGIKPTFEYWNGSAWTSFNPVDGTNGMRLTGTITWALDIISDWATTTVDSDLGYWVRITRTQNSLSIVPIEGLVQIGETTEYSWLEDGSLSIGSISVGTSSAAADSIVDVTSTTQGFLPPRMTEVQRDALGIGSPLTPTTGLTIYNTDNNKLNFYDGTSWEEVADGNGIYDGGGSLIANTSVNASTFTFQMNNLASFRSRTVSTAGISSDIFQQPTSININIVDTNSFDFDFTRLLSTASNISLKASTQFFEGTNDETEINLSKTTMSLSRIRNSGSTDSIIFAEPTSGIKVTTPSASIFYAADYSGSYTARSLVDKGYVDAQILLGGIYGGSGTVPTTTIATLTDSLAFIGGHINIKGAGITSGTTALLVEDSTGTDLFTVRDDGMVSATDGYSIGTTLFVHATYQGAQTMSGHNTFVGEAVGLNATGINGTGIGNNALINLTSGQSNTAVGSGALFSVTVNRDNTAIGLNALRAIDAGFNTAVGSQSFQSATTGIYNVGLGVTSGQNITSGNGNIMIGALTGSDVVGAFSHGIAIGRGAKITASNQMVIGSGASGAGVNTLYFGEGVESTAISATTFKMQVTSITDGSGTDIVPDYDFIIAGSQGTGTGIGSDIIFKTAPGGTTGTSQNPLVTALTIQGDGNVSIGNPTTAARLHIKGAGATSATTSLLVEDSAGTDMFIVRDDGKVGIGANVTPTEVVEVLGNVKVTGQVYSDIPTTMVPTGTTQTIDFDNGNGQILDLASATGDVTLTLSNPKPGATYFLKIIQDATTPRDLIYPASVKWSGSITPVISTGALAIDSIVLFWDGTIYMAHLAPNYG